MQNTHTHAGDDSSDRRRGSTGGDGPLNISNNMGTSKVDVEAFRALAQVCLESLNALRTRMRVVCARVYVIISPRGGVNMRA